MADIRPWCIHRVPVGKVAYKCDAGHQVTDGRHVTEECEDCKEKDSKCDGCSWDGGCKTVCMVD